MSDSFLDSGTEGSSEAALGKEDSMNIYAHFIKNKRKKVVPVHTGLGEI